MNDFKKIFGPNIETWDEVEEDRLEHLEEYVFDADISRGGVGDVLTWLLGNTRGGSARRRRRTRAQVCFGFWLFLTSGLLTLGTGGPGSKKKK